MQTVTEILIDFSASMKERLALVKEILLKNIIPVLDFSNQIGIKTFSADVQKSNSLVIDNVLPLGVYTNLDITKAIEALGVPGGNTPIALAIKNSVNSLKEFRLFDKKIVLITDGEENCGGNYELEAKKAGDDGVFCEIHVIGIGLNQTQLIQAKRISTLTSGSVSNISLSSGNSYDFEKTKISLSNFTTNIKKANPTFSSPVISSAVAAPSNQVQSIDSNLIVPKNETISREDNAKDVQVNNDENEISEEITDESRWEKYDKKLDVINEQLQVLTKELKKPESGTHIEIEEDAELNEKIRLECESYLNLLLRKKYHDRVVWLNEHGESGQDHDFEITEFDNHGIEYFIECKGTSSNIQTFYLTRNEWRRFLNSTKNYQLYFIMDAFKKPTYIFIDNFLDWILKGKLVPYSFKNEAIKKERIIFTILD